MSNAKEADLLRRIKELETANATLQVKMASPAFRLKVSEKGAISVFIGQRRWPVTLYQDEWTTVIAHGDEITAFIKANQETLKPAKAG